MSINERDYMQKCDGCGTLLSPDGICSNCGANGIFDTEKQSEKICEEVVRQWLLTICHDLCINVPSIILTKRSIESQYGRAAGQSTGGEITLRIDPEYDKNIYLFIGKDRYGGVLGV